jgi:serine/threonine protein kinase
MANPACPEPIRLKGLLDGTLPEGEQAALNGHLETCEPCQETLESLVAGGESWWERARQLGREQVGCGGALQRVMAQMRAEPAGQREAAHADPAAESLRAWLDAPARPGHLGRLGPYEVLEVIGRGGMGVVLRAFDPTLNRLVAIKVLAPQLAAGGSARKRFLREAQSAAAVSHEHVIAIHAVAEANGLPYLVMPLVRGVSLQDRLDRAGPLPLPEILQIGLQTAEGLAAAHAEGLIHRDIKPANILLSIVSGQSPALKTDGERAKASGPRTVVKITDFGLARAVHDGGLTQSGVIAGTPQYMAPEQARGERLDPRADLFSLGGVLYAMCTGQPPFQAGNTPALLRRVCEAEPRSIREINPAIPDSLVDLIARLHAKDPADRIQTAAEVAGLLRDHFAHVQHSLRVRPSAQTVSQSPPAEPGLGRWLLTRHRETVAVVLLVLISGLALLEAADVTRVRQAVAAFFSKPAPEVEPPPEETLTLRYGWKVGQTYPYAVRIVAEGETVDEVMDGNSVYAVRSVTEDGTTLIHHGRLFSHQRAKQGIPVRVGPSRLGMFSPFTGVFGVSGFPGESELVLDASGKILRANGSSQLPYALGNLSQLVLEPLGAGGQRAWEETRSTTMEVFGGELVHHTFGPANLGPPWSSPSGRRAMQARAAGGALLAVERRAYSVGSPAGDAVEIRKDYELRSKEMQGGVPRVRLAGDGRITFDVRAGLPRALEFRATLETATRRTPLTVTCKLLEGGEREQALHPPTAGRAALSEADLENLLADLQAADDARQQQAASRLAQVEVSPARRAEVARKLASLLDSTDLLTRSHAARALGVWGSADDVPALLRVLQDGEPQPRWGAIEALARLGGERAIEAVAERLADFLDRGAASKALQGLGAQAEPAIRGQLTSADDGARLEACKLLQTLGTRASVADLETAARDPNGQVSQAAQEALKAIASRP